MLSVVILCYKAEDMIIPFVSQIIAELEQESIRDFQLVLVANYDRDTKDTTPSIVSRLAEQDRRITVIAREKKGKMGWDMRSGLQAATGKYIAVIDGDGQMPVSDIPIVYNIIRTGKYDLVKTYRARRFDGWYRAVLSKVYNLLFKIFFGTYFPVRDINSKPKILTRKALDSMQLVSNDWFTDSEIMLQAFRHKMNICEVSTTFYKNERRKSFVGISTIFEFIWNLIYYRIKTTRHAG